MVSIKYLSKLWRILKLICINCEVNHIVNWYKECVISSNALAAQATILKKNYVSVVTL